MSTYNPVIYSGGILNVATLESELENELPTRVFWDSWGSSSIATATPTQLALRNVTLEADEVAIIQSYAVVSCGTTADRVAVVNYYGATSLSNTVYWTELSGAAGARTTLNTISRLQDQSGSIDLKTMWFRDTGSGTVYMTSGAQLVTIFKRRT